MTTMIDWERIDDCFLDMDGTLLDLHFDNHFWLEHVPRRYAEAQGLTLEVAKEQLRTRYRAIEGTLEWYCVDHWSRELGLDIALLKEEVDHLIAIHPHVIDFLEALAVRGKRRVLVTNAHQKALALKMERTRLAGHFEHIISAHELGLPKEDPDFWTRLRVRLPFDPARTLFVDDNLSVLRAAQAFGMGSMLAVLQPDSRAPRRVVDEFPAITDFADLLPGLRDHVAVGVRAHHPR
jgi:putative hydrolase of the HAD superfamily